MKNKKIRNALLCALAVPTMFMATGCKDKVEEISLNEYTDLVYEAGTNYYRNHTDYKTYGDMTINSESSSTEVEKETVSYKATATATDLSKKEVSISTKTTATQVIEINRDEVENGDIAIKITQTTVMEEKGERADALTQLLENYEEKTESTVVYTFVKTGTEYKLFKHNKMVAKETGEDDSTMEFKKVKTFASQESFQEAIESILDEVDDDLVENLFSAGGEMMFMSPETYKGKDNFGCKIEYSTTDKETDGVSKNNITYKYEFKDNLPYAIVMDSTEVASNGESGTGKQNMTITYSASAIAAPTDAADYTADNTINHSSLIYGVRGF